MKIIVITESGAQSHEAEKICLALNMGVDRLHIRKPDWSEAQCRELILALPESMRGRITLHDNLHLAVELGVGGVQLNGRCGVVPDGFEGLVSRSCHSLDEAVGAATECDYVTLSPIYDSISKVGYKSNFTQQQLQGIGQGVVAMGGITPKHIMPLWKMGFSGAALLGYIWAEQSLEAFAERVGRVVAAAKACENFALQYITHRCQGRDDLFGARAALEGGCRWVQLRMKESSDDELLAAAKELRELCDHYSATMLLDDRVHLVKSAKADGVHLGKNDMPPSEARELLGEGYIIGGTANTLEDIDRLANEGVDYIGMGPFRYTTTKSNLSPVIGAEGYRKAHEFCCTKGYSIPIVAIGGIGVEDIDEIMGCGVKGIALSGTILTAEDPQERTTKIIKEINKWRD